MTHHPTDKRMPHPTDETAVLGRRLSDALFHYCGTMDEYLSAGSTITPGQLLSDYHHLKKAREEAALGYLREVKDRDQAGGCKNCGSNGFVRDEELQGFVCDRCGNTITTDEEIASNA